MTRKVSHIDIIVGEKRFPIKFSYGTIFLSLCTKDYAERILHMELSEKIQKLRKEHGLTQEQFAEQLFVSRTAVSKWETGRGIPSIDSLKMIANRFHITLDQLISPEEVIVIAESEHNENIRHFSDSFDGILNLAALLSLFLPLYKVEMQGVFCCVPLSHLEGWQGIVFWIPGAIMSICGSIQMIYSGRKSKNHNIAVNLLATIAHLIAIILLILCSHPYPAVLFFFLFCMKSFLSLKKHH